MNIYEDCVICGVPSCLTCRPTIQQTLDEIEKTRCSRCGLSGAHFCPGERFRDQDRWDLTRKIDLETFDRLDGGPKCKKHWQYRALRRPRTPCEACWRRWIALHPA